MWKEIIENNRKKDIYISFTILTLFDWREKPNSVIEYLNCCKEILFKDKIGEIKNKYTYVSNFGREKTLEYTDISWKKLKEMLDRKEIKWITFFKEISGNNYFPLIMTFILSEKFYNSNNRTNVIRFSIDASLMQNYNIKEYYIKNITEFFKTLFIVFDGIYGYVDIVHESGIYATFNTTAFEYINGLEFILNQNRIAKEVRGYFWGNILTAGHIEALGGERKFKKEVPHYLLEKLPMKDEKMAYYIQLDEDIFSFNEEKYLELKDYFKPILPKENLKYNIYILESEPNYNIKSKLVYHQDELEKVRKEMEMNGEMQKIRTFLNQPSMTYEEQLAILEERKAKIMGRRQYIEFEIREGADPSHLEITIVFNSINKKQYTQIKKLINGWYFVGVNGGYGGVFTYIHEIWQEKNTLGTWVDMGAAEEPEKALKVLERMLNRYAEENSLWLKKAVIGEYEE